MNSDLTRTRTLQLATRSIPSATEQLSTLNFSHGWRSFSRSSASPRDAVFRAMETIVRANSTFQRIVKPVSFRTWQGEPEDVKPFTFEKPPACAGRR